jgi:hypothetical protein
MKSIYKIIFLLVVLFSDNLMAQDNQEMSSLAAEVPNIGPLSPTVASLMKFEEIPVNNYTGIPDVNIPVFSTSTLADNLDFSISLSYHPASVAVDEVASYTGLGWNLMVGGTISRTVRGIPDEVIDFPNNYKKKVGLYYDTNSYGGFASDVNHYGKVEDLIMGEGNDVDAIAEFKFMAYEKGKFDTQYDLYQYNVMGLSGRFIIKKNESGILVPIQIDDNRQYKILLDYELKNLNPYFPNQKSYVIKGFTLVDANGNKFIFKEEHREIVVESGSYMVKKIFEDGIEDPIPQGSGLIGYPTAFQLSEVRDKYGNLIVDFVYQNYPEHNNSITQTQNIPTISQNDLKLMLSSGEPLFEHSASFQINKEKIEPWRLLQVSTTIIETKKLEKIQINNKAKIYFNTLTETRLDVDRNGDAVERPQLKSIEIQDWSGNRLKKVELDYDYFHEPYSINHISGNLRRMILSQVREYGRVDGVPNKYELSYKNVNADISHKRLRKDPWGYFEYEPRYGIAYADISEKRYVLSGVLEKMYLPTGGYIHFDFEPNTYSFMGSEAVEDFSDNPENFEWIPETEGISFDIVVPTGNGSEEPHLLSNLNGEVDGFQFTLDYSSLNNRNWGSTVDDLNVIIKSSDINEQVDVKYYQISEFKRFYRVKAMPGSVYTLKAWYFGGFDCGSDMDCPKTLTISLDKFKKVEAERKYLYGGGIRIKSINFFEKENDTVPALRKKYNYNLFDELNKSSGSLSFAYPKYEYLTEKTVDLIGIAGYSHYHRSYNLSYKTKTDFNNLRHIRTQGADVGYENVRIKSVNTVDSSQDNGETLYTYISPRTEPEIIEDDIYDYTYTISYPFIPSLNLDYKRGHLIKSEVRDNQGRVVVETKNIYETIENPHVLTGVQLTRIGGGNPYSYIYSNYLAYKSRIDNCNGGYYGECPATGEILHTGNCHLREDVVAELIRHLPIYEASGWTRLKKSVTKEYFYNVSVPNVVETIQNYTYNNTNKQVQTQSTSNSLGEVLKKEYKYPQDLLSGYDQSSLMNSLVAKNRISEPVTVKTLNNNIVVAEQQTKYKDFGSGKILPEFVYAKKGTAPFENKITYNRYDAYGNLQQYTLADGTPVSIVWGYNGQYPIAKIEGLAYSAIQSQANALSTNNNLTESSFNALRTLVNSNNAMLSCYLYEPLVGVKMIIQPNGQKESYLYDEFGRLKVIKDHEGNVLKEFKYRYHNQP